jgi:hypothetical protein
MVGQMCWLSRFGQGGQLALHLRLEPHQPWGIYTSFPGCCVPEYNVPNGSKGWAWLKRLGDLPTSAGERLDYSADESSPIRSSSLCSGAIA